MLEMGPELAPEATRAIEPSADRFGGDVTVLIGPGNASGATNFAAVLRDHRGRVRLVGEPTGGSAEGTTAGLILFLKLPASGITVRVPVIRSFNAVGTFEPGLGVAPDVLVRETIASFRAGADPALDAALAAPSTDESGAGRLRALFRGLHERAAFHGSVLVAEGGRIVYEDHLGLADDDTRAPVTARTRFEIASVTKPITAYAVLMLLDEGALALDDPVAKHVEGFPYDDVTIRHLLNHTSGIPTHFRLEPAAERAAGAIDNDDVLSWLIEEKPARSSAPGASFAYNNVGYVVLAEMVAAVSGQPFADFLRERIFVPLGMTGARVYATRLSTGERIDDYALPYVRGDDGAWVAPESTDAFAFIAIYGSTAGDGSVAATVRDLLLFDRELRNPTLIRPETWALALKPARLADGEELWQESWVKSSYGLGWRIEDDRATHWHTGDWGGYLALMKRYPASDRVVIYLQNRRVTDWSWFGELESIMRRPGSLLD